MTDDRERALGDYLTRCADEYIADVNGDGEWRVAHPPGLVGSPVETYDVDPDVTEGPVVLVRRSDGVRFEAYVSVAVGPVRAKVQDRTPFRCTCGHRGSGRSCREAWLEANR